MKSILICIFGLFFPFIERLCFKLNPWLYIDLCIGRKNFYKFLKENSNITIFNDIFIDDELKKL